MKRKPLHRRDRGQITIIVGTLMIGLVGIVGLAIDGGMAYIVKAKLNAAVDSAAVAAARAVTNGTNQAEQTASARQAAQDFFAANFPSGYLMSTPKLGVTTVDFNTPTAGAVTIGVSASADKPLNLMKVLGFDKVAVAANSQTIRRDLDLIFVIDSSGSMGPVWSTVRSNANTFLDQFSPSTDRVGLVHFSAGAVSDIAINKVQRGFDRPTMQAKITSLSNGGNTNYAEGLYQARQQLDSILPVNRSSLRVIVFFSDGKPNTLAASYPLTGSTSTTVTTEVCTGKNGKKCDSTSTNPAVKNITSCDGGVTATGGMNGFYMPDQQATKMPGACASIGMTNDTTNSSTSSTVGSGKDAVTTTVTTSVTANSTTPTKMPQNYDLHSATDSTQTFKIVGSESIGSGYTVGSTFNNTNVANAAINVPLEMASYLRSKGTYIFTLGLDGNGGFDEGLLKSMANTADSGKMYNPNQPSGIYCYAKTINDLKPCFSKLASEILRISK
ncbi:vWA domain-containing protein [Cupriavidus numazuensis]|uniref:VWFA domain-containing protein n=1 Tax=Cupriavidus numazuensis TaxID=221992 RepID=A0ABN7Q6T3_9BURK|nr:vWA domain-containing protein [Cupriavidus numazuensis]CAG2156821.1 hypothetical protein LMG26411_05377 [Cupriavidus numazuensis]